MATRKRRTAKKRSSTKRRRNPSGANGIPVIAVNPGHKKTRRRRAKRRSNPSNPRRHHAHAAKKTHRRKSHRRRRNPSSGVGGILMQTGLAVLGGVVGLVLSRVVDKQAMSPKTAGGVKLGGALLGGAAAAMLSPAAGAGLAGALGMTGGSQLFDAFSAPATQGAPPNQLNAAALQLRGISSVDQLGALEELQLGAIEDRTPTQYVGAFGR